MSVCPNDHTKVISPCLHTGQI